MSDRSKWPRVVGEQFVQAWINLAELPGGMMRSYSPELGHFRYGPIPGTTSCGITTNPDDAQWWREQGQPVMEVYAATVAPGAVSLAGGWGDLREGQDYERTPLQHPSTRPSSVEGGELALRLADLANTSTDLKGDLWKVIYELRAAGGVTGSAPAEFKLVGKADFHMSAEMDVVIGTELFIRAPGVGGNDGR